MSNMLMFTVHAGGSNPLHNIRAKDPIECQIIPVVPLAMSGEAAEPQKKKGGTVTENRMRSPKAKAWREGIHSINQRKEERL